MSESLPGANRLSILGQLSGEPHDQATGVTTTTTDVALPSSSSTSDSDSKFVSRDASSASEAQSLNLVLSQIDSPERNLISQRVSKNEADRYFDHHDEDTKRDIYKFIEPIYIQVPSSEVCQIIYLDNDGNYARFYRQQIGSQNYHLRSQMFRKWFDLRLPSHFSPTLTGRKIELKFSHAKSSLGDSSVGPSSQQFSYAIAVQGHCSARENGCPTTFMAGFSEDQIKLLRSAHDQSSLSEHVNLEMRVTFAGSCNHAHKKKYGQLRGPRRTAITSRTTDNCKPGQLSKVIGANANDADFHSVNRLTSAPSRQVCNNLSRERRHKRKVENGFHFDSLSNLCNITYQLVSCVCRFVDVNVCIPSAFRPFLTFHNRHRRI